MSFLKYYWHRYIEFQVNLPIPACGIINISMANERNRMLRSAIQLYLDDYTFISDACQLMDGMDGWIGSMIRQFSYKYVTASYSFQLLAVG